MPSTSVQPVGPWNRYKRLVDNVAVNDRLVVRDGKKCLEIEEKKGEDFHCPNCQHMISKGNGASFPNSYLDTVTFHSAHRPLDVRR